MGAPSVVSEATLVVRGATDSSSGISETDAPTPASGLSTRCRSFAEAAFGNPHAMTPTRRIFTGSCRPSAKPSSYRGAAAASTRPRGLPQTIHALGVEHDVVVVPVDCGRAPPGVETESEEVKTADDATAVSIQDGS